MRPRPFVYTAGVVLRVEALIEQLAEASGLDSERPPQPEEVAPRKLAKRWRGGPDVLLNQLMSGQVALLIVPLLAWLGGYGVVLPTPRVEASDQLRQGHALLVGEARGPAVVGEKPAHRVVSFALGEGPAEVALVTWAPEGLARLEAEALGKGRVELAGYVVGPLEPELRATLEQAGHTLAPDAQRVTAFIDKSNDLVFLGLMHALWLVGAVLIWAVVTGSLLLTERRMRRELEALRSS